MPRYKVEYGTGRDNLHTKWFSDKVEAVDFAGSVVLYPFGYLFSSVYDTHAKGEVNLVWDNRIGYCEDYKG